jgi:hypothetical protein
MADLFSADYQLLWALVLGLALFFPVRRLIWVLYVRRAERDGTQTSNEERARLFRRAGMTAVLLCFVFAYFYTAHMFRSGP